MPAGPHHHCLRLLNREKSVQGLTGPPEKGAQEFMNVAITLERRIELFLALPIQRLDALALQQEVRQIGKT